MMFLTNIAQEVKNQLILKNPNLVPFEQYGFADTGNQIIVRDFIDGVCLYDKIQEAADKETPISESE